MLKHLAKDSKRSKYRLLGLVGQGQFGRVFCATHRKTGRLVALKELDHRRFPTNKFLRELRFLLSLQHLNIVTCRALEHTAGGRYLVMDYCEGGTLRHLMESEDCLTFAQGLELVLDVLAGLEHAHSRGIVHCDIKPENILLHIKTGGWTARISDFGVARLSQELAQEAGNTGSPAYMAPERFYGQYSHSSDLYAVGVLLFELLMGYRPFSGSPTELMSAHLNGAVKVPEAVPSELRTIILTALQKLPARRFTSAAAMSTALQSFVTQHLAAWPKLRSLELPLVKSSNISCSPAAFCCTKQEPLENPLVNLAIAAASADPSSIVHPLSVPASQPHRLAYQVWDTEQGCSIQVKQLVNELGQPIDQRQEAAVTPPVVLPDPIQMLMVRSQGCFAIAPRSIYLLSADQLGTPATTADPPNLQQLAQFPADCLTTIDPDGTWLATATVDAKDAKEWSGVATALKIWHLPSRSAAPLLRPVQSLELGSLCRPKQLLALDSKHFVVVSTSLMEKPDDLATSEKASDGNAALQEGCQICCSGKTLFEGFTRRGNRVGSWNLPISIGQIASSTVPYRVVATETSSPKTLLLIDLKPLRVKRIGIRIVPAFIASTIWGYILVDAQGQIVLLDEDGQQVGHVCSPASVSGWADERVTAIAPFNSAYLLMATWSDAQQQGKLYTLDFRQLEVDLMF